jgi:hypothetical protein
MLATRARPAIGPLVDLECRAQVRCAHLGSGAQREVLVGAREQAERLAILVALRRQSGKDRVGPLDVAAAGERQALELAQAQVGGPAFERRLQRVVGRERLALLQRALRGLDDRFGVVHPAPAGRCPMISAYPSRALSPNLEGTSRE